MDAVPQAPTGQRGGPVAPRLRGSGLTPALAVVGTIAIFFISQLAATLIILIYPALKHWSSAQSQAWLTNSTVAQFLLVLMLEALAVYMVLQLLKWRHVPAKVIGLVRPKLMDLPYALAGFAVYFPAFIGVYSLAQLLLPNINYDQKQQLGFDNATAPHQLILVFISLVILPPIAEEIMVRGLLFTGLRTRLKWLPTAVITSILFAAAHLEFGSGAPLLWTAAMDTFILSLVLCYLREHTRSLIPGMLLHALKNGVAFVVLYGMR